MIKETLPVAYTKAQYEIFFENTDKTVKVINKGRRFGITQSAINFMFECFVGGMKSQLWGDVSYGNIERYIEQYLMPLCKGWKKLPRFDKKKNRMYFNDCHIDFRSAEYPESWEGFGYENIFLNEAGIILRDRKLYEQSLLPMTIDYENCHLFMFGTPKGKMTKGALSVFYENAMKADPTSKSYNPRYWSKRYSSYDNPFVSKRNIDEMITDMPTQLIRQEIYGEFIDNENALMRYEWIKYYDELPEDLDVFIGTDLAISQKAGADYTVVVVLGRSKEGNIYIIDVFRERITFIETLQTINRYAERYNPKKVGMENVAYQKVAIEEMIRTTNLPIVSIKPEGDKQLRFMPLLARYEQGLVYHNRNLIKAFEDELLSFPESAHDDMVDAASYAFMMSKVANYSVSWL